MRSKARCFRLSLAIALCLLHYVTSLVAGTLSGAPTGDVFGDASWLRDPRFAGLPPLQVHIREPRLAQPADPPRADSARSLNGQPSPQKNVPFKNVHTYFRTVVELPAKPVRATLHITGDDLYKFYVNGAFVVDGPTPAYPFAHPYDTFDIARWLRAGRNCLAAHAYYHGVITRAFNSADNRSGFILTLTATFADGRTQRYTTDGRWKCLAPPVFSSRHMFGYSTQFNEDIDMRQEPRGWREVEFDDSAWQAPLIQRQDHQFVASITPPLEHWRAEPKTVKQKAAGQWFFDFGNELVGHTRIGIRGPRGHAITVIHAEELAAPATVRHPMRCNCKYEDRIILSGDDDTVEFYDYRGFRYLEIHDAPAEPKVWVDVRHYPFDAGASHLDASDRELVRIWELCKHGVRLGCQAVYVDCPQREKGQYTGDTYLTVLSHLLLTADSRLARKAIGDFQLSQRFDDGMLAVAPGNVHQHYAEWSLLWTPMLEYYYRMTGDDALVRDMVQCGALEKLHRWFAARQAASGLLTGVHKYKTVLVDWPPNLRGGYDYEGTKDGENTVVNAFYYHSLRAAARLTLAAGGDGSRYDACADRLREAFVRRLLDGKTGLFRDGAGSSSQSLHASAYPLCFGLVPAKHVPAVIRLIREKRLDCGIYGAPYFIEGCYRTGEHDLAYDLMIRSQDKRSWHEMLRSGATATMEAWAPELKWNTSWCHPCAATPIYLIVRCLMGLEPAEPGWKAVRVAPQLPASLDWIELRFPTVRGPVHATYRRQSGYKLVVPAGVRVEKAGPPGLPIAVEHASCVNTFK